MKFAVGRVSSYDKKKYEVREFSTLEDLQEYQKTVKDRIIIRFPDSETSKNGDWFDVKDRKNCGELVIYDDYL